MIPFCTIKTMATFVRQGNNLSILQNSIALFLRFGTNFLHMSTKFISFPTPVALWGLRSSHHFSWVGGGPSEPPPALPPKNLDPLISNVNLL